MTDNYQTPYQSKLMLTILLATLLHASALFAMYWLPTIFGADRGDAQAAGVGGVEISLKLGGRSQGVQAKAKSDPEIKPTQKPQNKVKSQPRSQLPKPKPLVKKNRQTVKKAQKVTAKSMPVTEIKTEPVQEVKTTTTDDSTTESNERHSNITPQSPKKVDADSLVNSTGAGGTGGETQNDNNGDQANGGGLPGSVQDYQATLAAWLERHKRYPKKAKYKKQQGVAMLFLEINKNGDVLNHRIDQSSGHAALDQATLAMVRRALPLPPMPPSMNRTQIKILVPVHFSIQNTRRR